MAGDLTPLVARRVDLPGSVLGFTIPPCNVHLTFLPVGDHWLLVALSAPGKPAQVARWLRPYTRGEINVDPGLSPRILRARFDVLPVAWAKMLADVLVLFLELTPEGSASVFVEDSQERVDRFVEALQVDEQVRQRHVDQSQDRVKLTPRQLEVLALAVALGYYETPHKLNLREIAEKLKLSVGGVSELLRRGESLIITNYVDSLSRSRWQDPAEPRSKMP
ncbi:MAG TPA: helix-turn-helix domain-containing protein [Candidatus Thermoplasmatota archaeon]|nr:helix-turn-helix domain-containing protein [Candidatus Thermoplasmatota archaeon]